MLVQHSPDNKVITHCNLNIKWNILSIFISQGKISCRRFMFALMIENSIRLVKFCLRNKFSMFWLVCEKNSTINCNFFMTWAFVRKDGFNSCSFYIGCTTSTWVVWWFTNYQELLSHDHPELVDLDEGVFGVNQDYQYILLFLWKKIN